jgi:5-methylcytosine-specific restriction endonuclease McrA
MRCVDFDPLTLSPEKKTWWDEWCVRSSVATDLIVEKWERNEALGGEDFNTKIWKDLKLWLLDNVFFGKCAYCETDISHSRQFGGDADHFRPKQSVRRLNKTAFVKATVSLPNGSEIVHPGYFWLAYSWQNLMPSCKECNSGDGKSDKLPVLNAHMFLVSDQDDPKGYASRRYAGYRYPHPEWLDSKEQPQICRPHWSRSRQADIDQHLRFGIAGIVEGLTEVGRVTISTLKLNSKELREARDSEQLSAEMTFLLSKAAALSAGKSRNEADQVGRAAVQRWIEGRAPYSLAVVHALKEARYI